MEGWSSPDQEPEQQEESSADTDTTKRESTDEPLKTEAKAGWYKFAGGLRFYDGSEWTDHYAPPPQEARTMSELTLAVAGGVLIAWFIIWLGAQIDNEHIYWPVKFVVDELPQGFR